MAIGDRLVFRPKFVSRVAGILSSKRAVAVSLLAGLKSLAPIMGIETEGYLLIAEAVLAWVAGDTVRATGALRDLLHSTRFWLTAISIGTTIVAPWLGFSVSLVAPAVTAISIVVLGKSWREMER